MAAADMDSASNPTTIANLARLPIPRSASRHRQCLKDGAAFPASDTSGAFAASHAEKGIGRGDEETCNHQDDALILRREYHSGDKHQRKNDHDTKKQALQPKR